jgi:hypothetical protein
MKIKNYLLVLIAILFISILFVPIENTNIATGIAIVALVLAIIYLFIRKK